MEVASSPALRPAAVGFPRETRTNRMKPTRNAAIGSLLFVLLATGLGAQQPGVAISVGTLPASFASASSATCGGAPIAVLGGILATEPVFVTLTSTPTQLNPQPLALRRAALLVGVKDCGSLVTIAGHLIPIDFSAGATPLASAPLNSFVDPFDPLFGPPLQGPSVIQWTLDTSPVIPPSAFPVHLVLQAIAEDAPGGAPDLLVSAPVEVVVIDPASGFAPTISGVSAQSTPCLPAVPDPSGPESGGTVITLTGTRFPVQTNWLEYVPAVKIGNARASGVVVHSPTQVSAVVPPAAPPGVVACPPATFAGPRDVSFANHPALSPLGVPAVSQIKFTYCSQRTPDVWTFVPTMLQPEGGALTILGSDFLYGADVVMTSTVFGTFTTTISPADADIQQSAGATCTSPTATQIAVAAPPFCSGPVEVKVINPDGVASTPEMVVYAPLDPVLLDVQPTVTIAGLAPATFSAMNETGSTLTITGQNFVPQTSPLFGAPTIPQGTNALFPTRVDIFDPSTATPIAQETGTVTSGSISVSLTVTGQDGPFRPKLGLQSLRLVNPPCVSSTSSAPVTILIRDALPPTAGSVFPNVTVPTTSGEPATVRIGGMNFFCLYPLGTPLPVTVPFTGTPQLADLEVPAVSFGGTFSPEVTFVSETEIIAQLPAGLAAPSAVQVTVYNPDGRSSTSPDVIHVVPRLTSATTSTTAVLDEATLLAITDPATNGVYGPDLSIVFVPNPTANDDRVEDIANGGDPAVTSNPSAYDGIFLFNTRVQVSPTVGSMRTFDFAKIDVPATIVLPAPVLIAPTGQVISAGVKRVIFKAASFWVEVNPTPPPGVPPLITRFYIDQNYPLVLRSKGDFTFDGILDVSGDSLVNHAAATSPTVKFQYRCEWQLPPAGGGLGGRGGLHYQKPLLDVDPNPATSAVVHILPALPTSLSSPSLLTTTASILGADLGLCPRERYPAAAAPQTWGMAGLGLAPVGGPAGSGGGGGHAGAGGNGQAGQTTLTPLGGVAWGNATHVPAGTPGRPPFDEYVYGSTTAPADFDGPLGYLGNAFPYPLFTGGSGGGGGGGSLALVMPCVSLGGRGGNGGGGVALVSDRVFKLGPWGRIHADGEKGLGGIDAFPIANGDPIFVLCAPGSGGGGAGGVIYVAAVADADLTPPNLAPGQHMLTATGGPGGIGPSTTVNTTDGGAGAPGRIRVVINEHSSMVSVRQGDFIGFVMSPFLNITPDPNVTNIEFFRYQSP
jgi:hypothetical protein